MTPIKDLQPGTILRDQPFAVTSVTERTTRAGKPYLDVNLNDKTGQLNAKVWEDAMKNVHLDVGKVAVISGRVGEYQGNLDLTISAASPSDESFAAYLSTVPTMVFDIETVGQEFDELGEWDQEYILHNLEKNVDEEEAKTKLGLHSLYGFVQSIGLYNPGESRGEVLCLTDQKLTPENDSFTYYNFKEEKDLLEKFWQICGDYDRFVTYNGRGFDWPFLIIRSGILRVKVPFEVDHYNSSRFIDLQLKINQGRSYKLEALCRAFGITNPKKPGVSGLHVSNLYHQGNHQEIADYVARDSLSTTELYNIWHEYLSGHLNF